MEISDKEFIKQFEDHSLDPKHFNHIGHLRIAWLYLNDGTLEQAIYNVTSGVSSYACSLGAADKFQHTLTEAIVKIMAFKMVKQSSFSKFLASNKDLIEDLPSILRKHYSHELLYSDKAKKEFVEPDLTPLSIAV
jgi:hypothetical protein